MKSSFLLSIHLEIEWKWMRRTIAGSKKKQAKERDGEAIYMFSNGCAVWIMWMERKFSIRKRNRRALSFIVIRICLFFSLSSFQFINIFKRFSSYYFIHVLHGLWQIVHSQPCLIGSFVRRKWENFSFQQISKRNYAKKAF